MLIIVWVLYLAVWPFAFVWATRLAYAYAENGSASGPLDPISGVLSVMAGLIAAGLWPAVLAVYSIRRRLFGLDAT